MNILNIYILKLKNDKYYVGKTHDVDARFLEHISGSGSLWTKLYEPISIEQIIPNATPYDEDKYLKEYMGKYGIDNVRGGSYVLEKLDDAQRKSLQKEIWGAKNLCFRCGYNNHFIKDCYANTTIDGYKITTPKNKIPPIQKNKYKNKLITPTPIPEILSTPILTPTPVSTQIPTVLPVSTPVPTVLPISTPSQKPIIPTIKSWFSNIISKVQNEFSNPDSNLRTGKF